MRGEGVRVAGEEFGRGRACTGGEEAGENWRRVDSASVGAAAAGAAWKDYEVVVEVTQNREW